MKYFKLTSGEVLSYSNEEELFADIKERFGADKERLTLTDANTTVSSKIGDFVWYNAKFVYIEKENEKMECIGLIGDGDSPDTEGLTDMKDKNRRRIGTAVFALVSAGLFTGLCLIYARLGFNLTVIPVIIIAAVSLAAGVYVKMLIENSKKHR